VALAAAATLGLVAGVGAFTLHYGDGTAYLSHDPEACANCHVMHDHFDSWQQSSHRHGAVCNDCHLPPGFVGKWLTKADNGFLHSLAFTTDRFPEPLQIKPRNARRAQKACLECHAALVHAMAPGRGEHERPVCVHCHSSVGHALR
jgi:cytochrome c nitrite reductase small subunit